MTTWSLPSLKLTIPALLIAFACIVVLAYYTVNLSRTLSVIEEDAKDHLFQRLSHLQGTLEYLMRHDDTAGSQREIAALASQEEFEAVALTDDNGRVVAATRRAWLGKPVTDALPKFDVDEAARATRHRRAYALTTEGGAALAGYAGIALAPSPNTLRPDRFGQLYIQYDLSMAQHEAHHRLLQQSLFWTLIISSLALLLWLAFHLVLTRRAESLIGVAERLATGDLSARSGLKGRDEIARLGQALDSMAGRIDNAQRELEQDMTIRKQAELAVRESEARLQQILNGTTAAIYVRDRSDRFLLVNREFERLLNTSQAQVVGKTLEQVFPTDTAAEFRANDQLVLIHGRAQEFEEQVTLDDGVHTYLSIKFPLHDTTGQRYAICGFSTDITRRKQSELALRQAAVGISEAQGDEVFQTLVTHLARALGTDYAFIGIIEGNDSVRTRALYAHGQIRDGITYPLDGSPCENVVGQRFQFYPDDVQQLFPEDELLQEIGMHGYAAMPLFGASEEALGLIAVLHATPLQDRELTESILRIFAGRAASELKRERADRELRESEQQYRLANARLQESEVLKSAIIEYALLGVISMDQNGNIVEFNPAAEKMFGHSRAQVLGRPLERIIIPEQMRDAHRRGLERYLRTAKSDLLGRRLELSAMRSDGSEFPVELSISARSVGGSSFFTAFIADLTDKKQSEAALRASEQQYRGIFNAATDGLAVWRPDGTIVDFNPALCRIYAYTEKEMASVTPRELVHPRSVPVLEDYMRAVSSDLPFHAEASCTRKDGAEIEVEVQGVPMRYRGKPHHLSIIRDITQTKRAEQGRRELEAQLRQSQKMEAIGHLTGGIAHDFNNLLTSMMGYCTLGTERLEQQPDGKLEKYLNQIRRSGDKARDLIQQMLTFSRGQRGEPRPLSLGPLINESCKLMRSTIPSSVEFRTDLARDLPPVMLDPVHIEQVMMNLCINARDAMAHRGTLDVSLRLVTLADEVCTSCQQHIAGRYVELCVEDSGSGMPAEVIDRIFEPFFTTKEVGKGTGMGLSTVHGIVHENGGHIRVHSEVGSGSTFRVLFPALPQSALNDPPKGAVEESPRQPQIDAHVLIVDDESSVIEFMGDLLESRGLRVSQQTDSVDALQTIRQNPTAFDLVITDQTMPRQTGTELARAIRDINPKLPVVLYSGYSEHVPEDRIEAYGIRAFIRKPVDIDLLFSTIQDILADQSEKP